MWGAVAFLPATCKRCIYKRFTYQAIARGLFNAQPIRRKRISLYKITLKALAPSRARGRADTFLGRAEPFDALSVRERIGTLRWHASFDEHFSAMHVYVCFMKAHNACEEKAN